MEKELAVSKLRLFFIFPNVLNYYHIVGLKSSLKSETLPRSHKDSIEHHKKCLCIESLRLKTITVYRKKC